MTAPAERGDAAICAALVRDEAYDHYLAILYAPAAARRALFAIQALAVELARVRALARQTLPGEIRLQWWRDTLHGIAHGSVEANPVAAEALKAIATHDLPVALFERMIDARRFDLYDEPMPNIGALENYLADTIGTVYALALRVLGAPVEIADTIGRETGRAEGIAQLLRAWPVHASRRQMYLPNDLLTQFGVTPEAVFSGTVPWALADVLAALAARGQETLRRVDDGQAQLTSDARSALLPLAVTRALLARWLRTRPMPSAVADIGRLHRLWLIWRAARRTRI